MRSAVDTRRELARLYREKRIRIEMTLFEDLGKMDLPIEYMGEANTYFGNGLFAALELGDPAYLEADLEWVKRLLSGRQIPSEKLAPYLAAYSHAIGKELGQASAPITEWLNSYMARDEEERA